MRKEQVPSPDTAAPPAQHQPGTVLKARQACCGSPSPVTSLEKKYPFGPNPCSSTSFLISESSISRAPKRCRDAKNGRDQHWAKSVHFPSRPLPVLPVALVFLHESVTGVLAGKCCLISDADVAVPQLRRAQLPGGKEGQHHHGNEMTGWALS